LGSRSNRQTGCAPAADLALTHARNASEQAQRDVDKARADADAEQAALTHARSVLCALIDRHVATSGRYVVAQQQAKALALEAAQLAE
jgi:hypothetical protein